MQINCVYRIPEVTNKIQFNFLFQQMAIGKLPYAIQIIYLLLYEIALTCMSFIMLSIPTTTGLKIFNFIVLYSFLYILHFYKI